MDITDVKVGVLVRAPGISIRNPSRLYRVVKARPTRCSELAVDLEAVSPPTIKKPLARIHWRHLVAAGDVASTNGHRSLAVEARYAPAIVAGVEKAGFKVEA